MVKGGMEEVRAESLGIKPMLLRRSSFVTGSVGRVMVVGGSRGGGKGEEALKLRGFLSTCTASQRVGPKGVVPLWISFQELHRERGVQIKSDAKLVCTFSLTDATQTDARQT